MARSASVTRLPVRPQRPAHLWQRLHAMVRGLGPRHQPRQRPNPFAPARPLPGVVPEGRPQLPKIAMDAAEEWNRQRLAMDDIGPPGIDGAGWMGAMASGWAASAYAEGQEWLGYAILALLSQRPEYRIMVETVASEMTREWIEFKSKSDDKSQQKRIEKIEARFRELNIKATMRAANVNDGFQGRGQIYIDTGKADNPAELLMPLTDLRAVRAKYGRGKFIQRLAAIEPMWCYPAQYDASDPLIADWYRPRTWWVMGKEVSRDRLLTFVGNVVPDMIKPAYSFGGIATTQMAKPYVDFWLRNRTSESDLLNNFSLRVLATELDVSTADEGSELIQRALTLNTLADNQGILLINRQSEEFDIRQTSLGGVSDITRQSMERMTIPSRMPIVKFFGNQPAGLNADSEGVIRMWYDDIRARQENTNQHPIQVVFELVQLEEFGEVIDDITWHFKDLWQLDEAGKMAVQLTKAQIVETDISSGVIDPEEGRLARAKDDGSPYVGLDLREREAPGEEMEEEQEQEEGEGQPGGQGQNVAQFRPRPQTETGSRLQREVETGAGSLGHPASAGLGARDEWREADHRRDDDGKFTSGGGGAGAGRADLSGAPEHIRNLKIPPAWTNVRYNDDPSSSLLVVGKDAKGRQQYIYSVTHQTAASAAKFARIEALNQDYMSIMAGLREAEKDPATREAAAAMRLIALTGIRPGSDGDTRAAEQAYGATTLEGRHVVVDDDGEVRLRFVGKKGVRIDIPVRDEEMAAELLDRRAAAGDDGRLFRTSSGRLLDLLHALPGGDRFKTKDFRTLLGTSIASDRVRDAPAPSSPTAYRRAVRDVAREVAAALGNTPTVALQSYIAPEVFGAWRLAAGA